jgi:hypothetical protein
MSSTQVQAQKSTKSVAVTALATLVASLPRGRSISVNAETYQLLTDVAVTGGGSAQSPAGAASSTPLASKGPYRFYRQQQTRAAAALTASVTGAVYPAVVNVQSGELGVVTGSIAVKLKNMADAATFGAADGLVLDSSFPNINLAIYRVATGRDVFDVSAKLSSDARVLTVTPEIMENFHTAQ